MVEYCRIILCSCSTGRCSVLVALLRRLKDDKLYVLVGVGTGEGFPVQVV